MLAVGGLEVQPEVVTIGEWLLLKLLRVLGLAPALTLATAALRLPTRLTPALVLALALLLACTAEGVGSAPVALPLLVLRPPLPLPALEGDCVDAALKEKLPEALMGALGAGLPV